MTDRELPDLLPCPFCGESSASVDARPDDPFHAGDLWPIALQRKGGAYALLATMPADPSLN